MNITVKVTDIFLESLAHYNTMGSDIETERLKKYKVTNVFINIYLF